MLFVKELSCSVCGGKHEPSERVLLCPNEDRGRLDIYYDYDKARELICRSVLEERRGDIWKYAELLPAGKEHAARLGVGGSPLLRVPRLGDALGAPKLLVKDETRGPTGSFKDRSMEVGVAKAVEMGYTAVVTASSGNAAAALAAQAAAAGLECTAFVLERASTGKLTQLMNYGARVVRVRGRGREDPTVSMMLQTMRKFLWYPCPSFGPFNPYQVEGPKTISYEIVEQMGWNVPEWVLVPSGSGCLMAGIWKGFRDFLELGLIRRMPRLVVVQSRGNAPIVRGFLEGRVGPDIVPWERPDTVATGLSDPFPWDGDAALRAVRETGGTCVAVDDMEIIRVQRLCAAREGIFGEPTGVAGLAGLVSLISAGAIDRGETVVVPVTGSGLKDLSVLEAGALEVPLIEPQISDFEECMRSGGQPGAQVPGTIVHKEG